MADRKPFLLRVDRHLPDAGTAATPPAAPPASNDDRA